MLRQRARARLDRHRGCLRRTAAVRVKTKKREIAAKAETTGGGGGRRGPQLVGGAPGGGKGIQLPTRPLAVGPVRGPYTWGGGGCGVRGCCASFTGQLPLA